MFTHEQYHSSHTPYRICFESFIGYAWWQEQFLGESLLSKDQIVFSISMKYKNLTQREEIQNKFIYTNKITWYFVYTIYMQVALQGKNTQEFRNVELRTYCSMNKQYMEGVQKGKKKA